MKPIQPKQPQQILPKPAGGSTQSKPVTLTQRTVGQPGGLVIGQNQAMLPNGNVATVSGHQLLLNHISLANMGHNQPFLISSGGAGLPSNLQLLVRPQTPGAGGHHHHHHPQHQQQPQQQQHHHHHHHQQMTAGLGSQATNMSVNNAALLAAFQVQNQAAQQALIGPAAKNLAGQGHAVMNLMGGSQNPAQAGANLQQNMIVNARVVSPNQQLQLQQIQMPQGPITLAFGPGGQLRALPGQFSNVLQGVAISTATVASSTQTLATTSSGVGVQQQQQHVMEVVQQNKGVNLLGDLLKQTGIVPEDSPTSPNQGQELQTQSQAITPPQVHAQQAAVITVNALGSTPIMTVNSVDPSGAPTQCLAQPGALGNGTQTIVVNQGNIPVAKLQAQQANSQLKLSLAQDGSFILQKPFPNELGQQAVQSLLLQRLSTQPQQQQQHQQQQQQAHIMNPFTASGANTSVTSSYIPVVVSNMNVCDPAHKGTASTTCATLSMMSNSCVDTVASTSTTAITTTPSQRSSSMLLSSMLNQSPSSSVVHTLAQNGSTEALGLQQATGSVGPVPVPTNVNMVVTASTTNVTALGPGVTVAKGCVDTATAGVIFGYPVASLQAGQKVQTVQLTPHNQEALQKVQTKLRALLSMGSHTQQQKQEIQSLQTAQQKILSKGKIISVQQVIPHQSPTQASLYVATPVSSGHTTSLSTVVSGTTAQFKFGNQIFTLAPQPAQSVHSAQKHVASNQQQQRFVTHSQGKDKIILKLPQQQQQQSIATAGTGHHDGNVTTALGNSSGNVVHIKTVGKVTTKSSSTSSQGPVNRGIKRAAVSTISRAPTVQQQLANDQSSILNPDHKTPFKSVEEACRRLLQYHLYNTKTPTDEDLWKADDLFETASEQLLAKAQVMTNKYRYLILKDSMKEVSSSELVMLDRIFIQEETAALERDKQSAKEGKKLDLPPPPAHWLPKIKEENCAKRVAAQRITLSSTGSPSVHPGEVPREPPGKVMAKPPNPVVKREPGVLHCTVANDVSTLTNPVAVASSTTSTTAVPSATGNSECTTVFLPGVMERNRLTVKKEMERPPSAERTGIGTRSAIGVAGRTNVKSEPCPSEDNYDEWAEIQKELEMYPVDATAVAHSLETSSSEQLDFDPPEDGGPGLVDFEPPLPKSLKYDGNFLNAGGHHPPPPPPPSQHLQCAVRKNAGRWESMHVTSGEMSTESSVTRQQQQHQRSEVTDGILADMDGFNGRFSRQSATAAKLDPGNGFGALNFNKSSREDAVVGGDSDCEDDDPTELKSQEEDLNAQVQCAINSILNLQRADESSDYETSEYNAFEVDADAVGSKEEEDEDEEEEEEEVEEDEEEEHMTMDYDVNIGSGVAGVPDGNEMDAALEEAVKSIL